MDQNLPNNSPVAPSPAPLGEPKPQGGSMGPLIGSIVVIIILVIGAIYFWSSKLAPKEPVPEAVPELSQNDSDEALQADIEATPEVEIDTNF